MVFHHEHNNKKMKVNEDVPRVCGVVGSYARLRVLGYPQTDCFLVCFAINDRDSLEQVRSIFVEEARSVVPSALFILVGTKSELRSSHDQDSLISISEGDLIPAHARHHHRVTSSSSF